MASINGFDFSKYDVGGTQKGDKAGDKKLTGDEAKKARADGWTVWDGFIVGDKVEHVDNNDNKSALWQGLRTMFNMHSSDSYIKFNELKNKIIEQKMAEQGIYPWKHGDDNIWDCDSKEYQIAEKEADAEARKKLGLSKNTFDTGMKIIPKSIISDKSKEKNDANQKPSILGSMNNEILKQLASDIRYTNEVNNIFSKILKDKYSIDTTGKDFEELKKLREQYKEDFETAKTQAREKTGLKDAKYVGGNEEVSSEGKTSAENAEASSTSVSASGKTSGAKKAGGAKKSSTKNKTSNTYQKTACPTIFKKGDKYYRKSNDGKYIKIGGIPNEYEKNLGITSYKIIKINKDGSYISISNKTKNGIQHKVYFDNNDMNTKRIEYRNGKVWGVGDGYNGSGHFNRMTYYDKNGKPIKTVYFKIGDKNGNIGLVRNHKTGRWEKPKS